MLSVFRLLWLPTVTSVLNLPGSVKSHAAARKESFFSLNLLLSVVLFLILRCSGQWKEVQK